MKLTLVTPEKRVVLEQEVDKLLVPAFRGELDLLEGHSPMLTTLSAGILRWKLKSETNEKVAVINWGYCEVHPKGVEILVDKIDFKSEIEENDVIKTMKSAEQKLLNETLTDAELLDNQREIQRGQHMLDLLSK